jgi:caffeic acid 3-O-methyltransferase
MCVCVQMILHDWNDEQCLKILENCHAALPSDGSGKLIILEMLMPEETPVLTGSSTPLDAMHVFKNDFYMQFVCPDGRERSKAEFECLTKRAGFTTFKVVQLENLCIMESFK